jgi:hypothetical protein
VTGAEVGAAFTGILETPKRSMIDKIVIMDLDKNLVLRSKKTAIFNPIPLNKRQTRTD